MRLTYLIVAHKNPEQLARLVKSLSYDGESFFIHIDKKCNLKAFQEALQTNELSRHIGEHGCRVEVIYNRVSVVCGAYSHVGAIFNSLAEIFSSKERFDYLVLLSGQDYPIKTNEHIRAHFVC